jgi:hypothetical protein
MQSRRQQLAGVLFAFITSLPSHAVPASTPEERIATLERQVAELQTLLRSQQNQIELTSERLELDEKAIASNTASVNDAHLTQLGTKLSYGGFIKVDSMVTRYSDGKPANTLIDDFLVPSLIPTSAGDARHYTSTSMHAKTSRLFFKTQTGTDRGRIDTHFEMDFAVGDQGDERVTNSFANRLRHAYVKWQYAPDGAILAGQTWSTFFDVRALPVNLDFVGPAGTVFNRQSMVRWSTGPWMFAIENPRTRLNGVGQDDFSEGFPDLVTRYNGRSNNLDWSVAMILRELTYEDAERRDAQMGYGVALTGKYQSGRHDIRFGGSFGDALGRYLALNGFNDGYVDQQGNIGKIDQMGGFVAYRHQFSDAWSGGLTLSLAKADNPSPSAYGALQTLAKQYETGHLNLIYSPTERLSFGGELVLGKKELENSDDGLMTRMLMSIKYGI